MSFVILGRDDENKICVLDTDDLVTDTFTDSKLKSIQDKFGVKLLKVSKESLNVGIQSKDNCYQVFINGYESPIYFGEFKKSNNRNDLFGFEIKLADVGVFGNKLIIAIAANCWCKYDIEVPMIQCQVLSAPIKNVKNLGLACYTEEPIYFSTSDVLNMQYKQCMEDFPEKSVDQKLCKISISKNELSIFGVEYSKKAPVWDNINKRLNFNVVKGY